MVINCYTWSFYYKKKKIIKKFFYPFFENHGMMPSTPENLLHWIRATNKLMNK